jgi:hypothetical protein
MGEPVESVSGDLWPKTRVVMGWSLGWVCKIAALIAGRAGLVTGQRVAEAGTGFDAWRGMG